MMTKSITQAIVNLRAEVLLKKLAVKNIHLTKAEALQLVTRYSSDGEAFKFAAANSQPFSPWLKTRISKFINYIHK